MVMPDLCRAASKWVRSAGSEPISTEILHLHLADRVVNTELNSYRL